MDKSTEWALLFPLKTGLFAIKSSTNPRHVVKQPRDVRESAARRRASIRRGSSLSDLDKLQPRPGLPDVVRSAEKVSESLPHSPAASRTSLCLVRGSIGDLMNLKKYGGSNWSVRSESLVARMVPLSTVTARPSEAVGEVEDSDESEDGDDFGNGGRPLTCAQRTQRLSRLIRRQHRATVKYNRFRRDCCVSPVTGGETMLRRFCASRRWIQNEIRIINRKGL